MNYITKTIKDPSLFLIENRANNETHKNIFRFKVTSINENFELEETKHQKHLRDRTVISLYKRRPSSDQDITPKVKAAEIKKTVTFIDLVVNKQILIFLNTIFYIAIYTVIHYLM